MSKKKLWAILSVIILTVSAGLFFYFLKRPLLFKFEYEPGMKYTYSLHYKSSSKTFMLTQSESDPLETLAGNMDYNIDIVFRPFKKENDRIFSAVSFENLRKTEFFYGEENLFHDPSVARRVYLNDEAVIKMNSLGKIEDIMFKKDSDIVFVSTMKLILADIQVSVTDKNIRNPWEKSETTQYGETESSYTLKNVDSETISLEKIRLRYSNIKNVSLKETEIKTDLKGSWKVSLNRKGYLEEFKGSEKINITDKKGRNVFDLDTDIKYLLKSIEKEKKTYGDDFLKSMISSKIGIVEINEKMKTDALKNRAKEMTRIEMLKTLKTLSEEGEIYDQQRFWWRVSGYLKLYPERCADLIPLFKESSFDSKARIFVFGILASVGHEEAQKTMRELIVSQEAQNDKFYIILLQNFSILEHPDPNTVKLISSIYDESFSSKNIIRAAASLTVGALAGKLKNKNDLTAAYSLNNKLLTSLENAVDAKEKEYLLDALGNSRIENNIKTAAKYVNDKTDEVRASVANALRNTQTEESEKILFELTQDEKTIVQRQSLNALSNYDLKTDHLKTIESQIRSQKIGDNLYLDVAQLLMKYPEEKDTGKNILEYMKENAPYNTHLKAKINTMLQNMGQ
ncbi:MAG TPA: HEAT repeat domain-containing protein [bacterium]|nr:HEAT repeat domain-containing protein [bacterium]